jgi:hypothetical protein
MQGFDFVILQRFLAFGVSKKTLLTLMQRLEGVKVRLPSTEVEKSYSPVTHPAKASERIIL